MSCFSSGPSLPLGMFELLCWSALPPTLTAHRPLGCEKPRPRAPSPTLSMDSQTGPSAFYLLVPPALSSSQACMRPGPGLRKAGCSPTPSYRPLQPTPRRLPSYSPVWKWASLKWISANLSSSVSKWGTTPGSPDKARTCLASDTH